MISFGELSNDQIVRAKNIAARNSVSVHMVMNMLNTYVNNNNPINEELSKQEFNYHGYKR
jgi:hypothetical protein